MFDPLGPFNRISAESNRKLEENLQKVRETLREREERETERNKLLKNINEDTKKILDGLINLEKIIQNNLNITEGNLIKIQEELKGILSKAEPSNLYEALLNEVKKQSKEKSVDYGLQVFITGLKMLFGPFPVM